MQLLVEYKFFEPAFYSTDLPDWGTAALVCRHLGPQAQVLVDTGHHPQGTNIEQIVALLLAEGLLGGFHFNNRKYADDDLIVGSIDPFELFRIMREIALAEAEAATASLHDRPVAQRRGKIDAMIQSVMNIQTAYAKALLVDEALDDGGGERRRARRASPARRRFRERRPPAPCPVASGRRPRARPGAGVSVRRLRGAQTRDRGTASVESAYEKL